MSRLLSPALGQPSRGGGEYRPTSPTGKSTFGSGANRGLYNRHNWAFCQKQLIGNTPQDCPDFLIVEFYQHVVTISSLASG
jgi:hypothetical protein